MKLIRVGVDLAKNVFQVHGVDRNEKAIWRRKLLRENWLKVLLETVEPDCEIGMESCGGAHHWARLLQAHGFKVRLIAPQFVNPYVKSNKNDANDAEAICEAMSRRHMRFGRGKECGATRLPGSAPHSRRVNQATHGQSESDSRPDRRVRVGGAEGAGAFAQGVTVLAGRCREWLERAVPSTAQRTVG